MKLKKPTTRQLSVGLILAAILIAAGFLVPSSQQEPEAERPVSKLHTEVTPGDEHHDADESHGAEHPAAEKAHGAEHHDNDKAHEGDGHKDAQDTSNHDAGHHDPPSWLGIPVFFAFFGTIGCILLIIVAKSLGALFLQRKEDIYD